ncbi:hypothetical protein B9Q13_02960 [Candidatus Marsarchaeota G2 archaeon ECH_B_SAG-G16]|jgi:cysteine desulfurase family protein (TIGR01976 family)|uniref:Aminotransferase class V domain-containing protein n=2 Tax=Candidatus Marsarchaeota TaxID=1978152 RepID=A0A2R6C2L8_9ARCH|nr:MAG: hypothetical protein B9Q13_02960 [Candidatus Marsarchaeota G2 archaeon ECH_B_SAG-G16]
MIEPFLNEIRAKFPRCSKDAFGKPRIFLDNGAGSMVLEDVAKAEFETRLNFGAEHGAPAEESKTALEIIQKGREDVANLVNAQSRDSIVSGESATSLLFNLSYAIAKSLPKGGNVVISEYEHYANVSPWLELKERGYIDEVRFVKFDRESYELDVNHLSTLIDKNTKVVSLSGASNVLGCITPLEEASKIAHESGALFVVDAVHLIAHYPVDVQKIDCDFLVFSCYKLFGRFGSFMYGKPELLRALKPYKVEPAPEEIPWRWEHGNRDPALFACVSAVTRYYEWLGQKLSLDVPGYTQSRALIKKAQFAIKKYEEKLCKLFLEQASELKRLKLFGPADPSFVTRRVPTFSFVFEGIEPKTLVERLWKERSIFVREENFYSYALSVLGLKTVVRASAVHYNTQDELSTLISALKCF